METALNRSPRAQGWVLYDGSCHFCRSAAARFRPMLLRRGFQVLPLQAPAVSSRLKLPAGQLLREMRVITAQGEVVGGAAALVSLARHFWWGLPLYWFSRLPGCKRLLALAYAWVAAHRYCISGACSVGAQHERWTLARIVLATAPLVLLPVVSSVTFQDSRPWLLMWALAAAIWFGLKWLTFFDAWRVGLRPSFRRSLAYMFAWPNTDAHAFLNRTESPVKPSRDEWWAPVLNAFLGLALLYIAVRLIYPVSAPLSGWAGMIGLILVLHFGGFQLLALLWRRAGINAIPVMRSPLKATSLAEFWGRRWNTGFSDPARRYLHVPLAKRIGPAGATGCVFLISGLMHEIVISLPAGGGYGFPTAYFLLQAVALQFERSRFVWRLGLCRGVRGWLFTFGVTAGPGFLLFHPVFISEVILPFLAAIGALKGVAL